MKGKTFLILLVLAGFLAVLSFLRLGGETKTGEIAMGDKLFADLRSPARRLPVNAVARVAITDAENQVNLVMGDAFWQVEERNGYPAEFDELRDMVVKLSRLKIGRTFSGSPESLTRLNLMPPATSDNSAGGKQITLKDASGNILADVILGQVRETDDGGGGGGQYLKKVDTDTVFLVDGNFQFLKTSPAQWLKKEILNINANDVASVACYAGDVSTPIYTLSRPKQGEAAQMTPVPQGRTVDPNKIDQVLDALAPLSLDDVEAAENMPTDVANRMRLVYELYDGRRISLYPGVGENDNYTLRIQADGALTDVSDASVPEAASDDEQDSASEPETEEQASTTPSPKTAEQLNEALTPWVFLIKKWQYDSFITEPKSLLEAVQEKGDGTS